jgi:hypothetical protein
MPCSIVERLTPSHTPATWVGAVTAAVFKEE